MRIHFSGVGGAGMNPLARVMAARGHAVSGSDRDFDRGRNAAVADLLRAAGLSLLPQDGSAIVPGLDRLVHSTAVEAGTPELRRAAELGIACQPRPALLAELVAAARPGVAVAGTSGKSTVVGMLAWILECSGRAATVLGGAALALEGANHMGCVAIGGAEEPLIAEACESDGTLIGYRPAIGLVHNVQRDHGELAEVLAQFQTFAGNSARLLVAAGCAQAAALAEGHPNALVYGAGGDLEAELLRPGPLRCMGIVEGPTGKLVLDLPQPGSHTFDNAVAALALALELGIDGAAAAEALREFPGVARRFQLVGSSPEGIRVIDDYAHNGAKIAAAISAAQLGCNRLVAVFQPHGFGPARFLRDELRELLPQILRPQDRFCYAPIYDAGGTVTRDISSADLAADLAALRPCGHAEDADQLLAWISETAMPGDTVLLMGARDPRLGELARAILDLL